MGAYQQAQKTENKKNSPVPSFQTESSPSVQKAAMCSNCNAELPETALFCPECGLSAGKPCPKCGAPAPAIADICEACGAWLLKGQCMFCYAEIPDGALFCPECGKPKDGIPCPHCGTLSIFDFCTKCGKPVTEEAAAELKLVREETERLAAASAEERETALAETAAKTLGSNQEARRWHEARRPSADVQTAEIAAELARLEEIINSKSESEPKKTEDNTPEPPAPPARKSLFSDKQLASIRKTGAVVDAAIRQREAEEAERKRREEEERKRREEERQRQIREAQERKEALERARRPRYWRCNAYGAEHNDPNECSAPYMGGYWV